MLIEHISVARTEPVLSKVEGRSRIRVNGEPNTRIPLRSIRATCSRTLIVVEGRERGWVMRLKVMRECKACLAMVCASKASLALQA